MCFYWSVISVVPRNLLFGPILGMAHSPYSLPTIVCRSHDISFWFHFLTRVLLWRRFLSINWPMTLIASLLLTFFWSQLISMTSLEIKPIITRSKIPAVIVSVVLMVLELIAVSLRMASVSVSIVFILNGAIYFLVCVACMVHYVYVSTKVLLFLRKLPKLNKKQNVLQRVR